MPIPDLLRQYLLQGGGDDLALVGFQLVVSREIDLNAALHCRAGHFIYVALEAFQEIQRKYHRGQIVLLFPMLIKACGIEAAIRIMAKGSWLAWGSPWRMGAQVESRR